MKQNKINFTPNPINKDDLANMHKEIENWELDLSYDRIEERDSWKYCYRGDVLVMAIPSDVFEEIKEWKSK